MTTMKTGTTVYSHSTEKSRKSTTAKEKFQKNFGLYEDRNHFLVGVTTPLFEKNNADVWTTILQGMSDMGFQVAMRANASKEYKEVAESFIHDHSGLATLVPEDEYDKIYEVADVLLTFSTDDETITQVNTALSKGVIPIVSHDFPMEILQNYNPNLENGNCFMYYKLSPWSIFASLIRTYENYRFPYDWKQICKSAVRSVQ